MPLPRLADHIERTVRGPMWHGHAIVPLLEQVTAEQASQPAVPGAHSIWELVLHVTAWAEIVRDRIANGAEVDPTADEDWPPVTDTSEAAWRRALARLEESHRALAADVRQLAAARLSAGVAGREHRVYDMLHGVVEHGCYHGGQMALLLRAQNATLPT